MPGGQEHAACTDIVVMKTLGQLFCGLLAALVRIRVEGETDSALAFTQLAELVGVEMRAQRAGHVGKASLPQYGIVEQTLDQDDRGEMPHSVPAVQAAFRSWQEAMRKGGADAASVEVDDVLALIQRKDDALIKSIGALRVDEAESAQQIERMTLRGEMSAQYSAGRITDAEFLDQRGIMQPAAMKIVERLRVSLQLLLIENGSLFQHCGEIRLRSNLRIQADKALA